MDSSAGEPMVATVRVVRLDASALVWATGTLDGTATPELHRVLDEVLAGRPTSVVLDLAQVEAIDDTAVTVLAAASVRMARRSAMLALRLPGGHGQVVPDVATLRAVLASAYPHDDCDGD